MPWLTRHRRLVLAMICALCTGIVLLARFAGDLPFLSLIWSGEQSFQDVMQREGRKTATRPDFVFLGIDESTLDLSALLPEEVANHRAFQLMTERPYPWSREVWALLLDRLSGAGARLVMFDMIFSPPNDGDSAFREALDRFRERVVLGANFDLANGAQAVVPHAHLVPPPQMQDDRVGYVIVFPDPLGQKTRTLRYTISERQLADLAPHPTQQIFESFSARALTKLGRSQDVPRDLQAHRLRFSALDSYPARPLYEVFDAKFWRQNYAGGAFFKDKIVIIGASSQVAHDVVDTPISPALPGPAFHLHAIAAALAHEFLHVTSARVNYALVCGAGFLAWGLIAFVRRPLGSIVLLLVLSAAYLGLARLSYDRAGLLLLAVPVLSAFLASGLLSLGFDYALERLEKLRTRRALERYVSKNLVKEILENPGGYYDTLRGARMPATILFSDIVGFTPMTESADPVALVAQLNEYLSRMISAVFEHEGTLDKFIGDAVMAVWGNVRSRGVAEDAKLAARAALAMRRELHKLNQKWRREGRTDLGIGIGLNQGEVLVGNIGSQERMDPTVIGDAVNLASRLERLTRTYGVDILVGPSASDLIRDDFHLRSVARVQVKGKTQALEICALLGARDEAWDAELIRGLETYEEGLGKFRTRDFANAKILFARFLEFSPEDKLAKMYLARSLEYEEAPPGESWNATDVFTKK